MAITPGTSAKRGPGRPKTDEEPRRARVLAAQLVYQVVHLAAMRVCDGKEPDDVLKALRADLHELVPLERLSPGEWLSLERRAPTLTFSAIGETGGPNKWAAQVTAWLLGHGPRWYRDSIERSPLLPWPPGKTRHYSSVRKLMTEMERHPVRFDNRTPNERLFLRLPAQAQTIIGAAVRKAWHEEMFEWAAALDASRRAQRKDFPLVDYFARPLRARPGEPARLGCPLPRKLIKIVWTAVFTLPVTVQREVFRLCWRGRDWRKGGADQHTEFIADLSLKKLLALGEVNEDDRHERDQSGQRRHRRDSAGAARRAPGPTGHWETPVPLLAPI